MRLREGNCRETVILVEPDLTRSETKSRASSAATHRRGICCEILGLKVTHYGYEARAEGELLTKRMKKSFWNAVDFKEPCVGDHAGADAVRSCKAGEVFGGEVRAGFSAGRDD